MKYLFKSAKSTVQGTLLLAPMIYFFTRKEAEKVGLQALHLYLICWHPFLTSNWYAMVLERVPGSPIHLLELNLNISELKTCYYRSKCFSVTVFCKFLEHRPTHSRCLSSYQLTNNGWSCTFLCVVGGWIKIIPGASPRTPLGRFAVYG
jgi:hypothetical protein